MWLERRVTQWRTADFLQAARRSRDDVVMGRRARDVLGELAELPHWNAALCASGDRYVPVRNEDASSQAGAHLRDMAPELRAIIRAVALSEDRPARFVELSASVKDVPFPPAWADQWWQVPFSAVAGTVADVLATASVADEYSSALRAATSREDLREILLAHGADPDTNPYELAADNLKRWKATLAVVHDAHSVWLARKGAPPAAPPDAEKDFPQEAYLHRWDDCTVLARSLTLLGDSEFTTACKGCARAEDVQAHLGLTRDDVEKRQQERQNALAEEERKSRTHLVAGGAFEVGKDDLGALFGRLGGTAAYGNGLDIKAGAFTSLTQPEQGQKGGGGGGGKKTSHRRPSPELRELLIRR